MGMSDKQTKLWIRELMVSIKLALEVSPDNPHLIALLERLQIALED